MDERELIDLEADLLSEDPCQAWSPEGAAWNLGDRRKPLAEVLRAEREARLSYTREETVKRIKQSLNGIGK